MSRDNSCPRCGAPLAVVRVQVPVYLEHLSSENLHSGLAPERVLAGYEYREDVADCVRCTGAY